MKPNLRSVLDCLAQTVLFNHDERRLLEFTLSSLRHLPTMDIYTWASHCILCCLSQYVPPISRCSVFVLHNWTFLMCSDACPVSPRYCAPHSHGSRYITFFVSKLKPLGMVLLSKLPMVLRELRAVHTPYLLIILLIFSEIHRIYGITTVPFAFLVSSRVFSRATL